MRWRAKMCTTEGRNPVPRTGLGGDNTRGARAKEGGGFGRGVRPRGVVARQAGPPRRVARVNPKARVAASAEVRRKGADRRDGGRRVSGGEWIARGPTPSDAGGAAWLARPRSRAARGRGPRPPSSGRGKQRRVGASRDGRSRGGRAAIRPQPSEADAELTDRARRERNPSVGGVPWRRPPSQKGPRVPAWT